VVPDFCELQGTVRTFTVEVLDMIEQAHAAGYGSHLVRRSKPLANSPSRAITLPPINHPRETQFTRNLLNTLVGAHNVKEFEPTMAAEDFSFFLLEKPGWLFPDRQWRRQSSDRRPRRRALHAAQTRAMTSTTS